MYDSCSKFKYYRRLKSLRDYVLIHQDQHLVGVRSRESGLHVWSFGFFERADEEVLLPSLGPALPMADLYRGMRFSAKRATLG